MEEAGALSRSGVLVDRVDPGDILRLLDRLDVEIDDHRLVVAAHHDALERLVAGGVDLLVRDVGRHEDEVAGAGLGDDIPDGRPSASAPCPFTT